MGAPHPPLLRGSPCAPGQSQTEPCTPQPRRAPPPELTRGAESRSAPSCERCGRTTREGGAWRHIPAALPLLAGGPRPAAGQRCAPTLRAEHPTDARRPVLTRAGGAVWASPSGRGPGAGECSRTPSRVARAGGERVAGLPPRRCADSPPS